MQRTKDIPFWLYGILAFAPVLLQIISSATFEDRELFKRIFLSETGFIEILGEAVMLPAIFFAVLCGKMFFKAKLPVAGSLLFVYALGCVFILGEELSWGQHIFQWQTPEFFMENNKSKETNLHNISGFHRGTFKWILVGGMAFGGIILPLITMAMKKNFRPIVHWFIWMLPTRVCMPIAILIAVGHISIKYLRKTGMVETSTFWDIRAPEVTELHLAFFFFFYVYSMYIRMKQTDDLQAENLIIGP